MTASRYNIFHAIAAAVVLIFAISDNFWHNFLHGGFAKPPAASVVCLALGIQIALFCSLLLVLWVSTLFAKRPVPTVPNVPIVPIVPNVPTVPSALKLALVAFTPICLVAFGLEFASVTIFEKVFNLQAAGQDLVKWLQPGTYPLHVRLLLIAFALFEAPLVEEPLFRGIVFRGLAKSMPIWAAMAASGFLFALIHVNAATFVPLWFLGVAFAWLYWKTNSILAPMTAHFLFNLLNLVLVLSGLAT